MGHLPHQQVSGRIPHYTGEPEVDVWHYIALALRLALHARLDTLLFVVGELYIVEL